MPQRKLQHLTFTVAVSAIATAGLTLAGTKPVLAEFQIQEAGIEKGEVEIEYRGAYHWGCLKRPTRTRMPTISFKAMNWNYRWASATGGSFKSLAVSTGRFTRICKEVQSRSRP